MNPTARVMRKRIAEMDWTQHPLGPRAAWSPGLRQTLDVMLELPAAMWLGWGRDLYFFPNDACLPLLGSRAARAPGRPCREVWEDLWPALAPGLDSVLSGGGEWSEDAFSFLTPIEGRTRECCHRFCVSPVRLDQGGVDGVVWLGSDETTAYLRQRRAGLLRAIADDGVDYLDRTTYFNALASRLSAAPADLPFCLVYAYSETGHDARLVCRSGPAGPADWAPERIGHEASQPWPVDRLRESTDPILASGLQSTHRIPAIAPWKEGPDEAVILPLATATDGFAWGFLVAGLNPHCPYDEEYRQFVVSLASHIASGLARVHRREAEHLRVESMIEHERTLRTDAERLARALRESSERLSASLTAAGTGTFRWDLRSDTFAFDDSLERLFALPAGTRTRSLAEFLQLIHPDDRDRVVAASDRVRREGAGLEVEFRVPLPDGSTRWLDEKGRTFFDTEGAATYMIGACVDITDRKQAETFVWRQKDVLEQIVRGAPLTDVLETLTLDIEQVSERRLIAAVMMLEADGRHLRSAAGRRLPDGWNRVFDRVEVGTSGGSAGAAALRKERVVVPDVMTSPLWSLHRLEAVRRGLRACWSTPILSSHGAVLGTLDIYHREPASPTEEEMRFVDIVTRTAAIAVERESSERALAASRAELAEHAQRLEERVRERTARLQDTVSELESFSYSISHDMRAPLRAMQSFAQILEEECGDAISAEGKDYIRRIIGASHRMDRLIQDVLSYSRVSRTEVTVEPVDLEQLVDGILETYPHFQAPNARIEVVRPMLRVLGNEAALSQCLSNLIGNALKFVVAGTVPHVRIWTERHEDRVRLCVRDNGIGIEPEAHEKIFRMFYQVDRSYDGTGIGLAIVRKAAERMGARIGLRSEPHRGSTFYLDLLPAS